MVEIGVLFLFEEMKEVFDLKLKFGVYCLIFVFEECGFICCLLNCVCVFEVIKLFEGGVVVKILVVKLDNVIEMFKCLL